MLAGCQPVTELPVWAIWLSVFLVPAVGIAGGLIGHWLARKGTKEADNRGRRDEAMRHLRWASEQAVAEDPHKAQLGVDHLVALAASALLTEDEKVFIDATLASAIREPQAE